VSDVTLTYPGGELPLARKAATVGEDGFDISDLLKTTGAVTLDAGFVNTASCTSAITYIDGDQGILRYRGYPIEQLAAHSSFLEVSYLLIYGSLPDAQQLIAFEDRMKRHTMLHEDLRRFFDGFPRDAHPMPVLSSAVSALSTFYQDSLDPFDRDQVDLSTVRLLAKVPTIAAYAYKKSVGQPYLYPDNSLSLNDNFLRMTFGVPAEDYQVNPVLSKALDLLLILHADHEQNCSTSTVRLVGSSHANLFASVSAGINALFGPLHGGANQAVLEMLRAPRLQELRPASNDRQADSSRGFRRSRHQRPVARHRHASRGGRALRRLLHLAAPLPQRRLLHRPHLQGDGLPAADVHGDVRARPAPRLDRPVARDDR